MKKYYFLFIALTAIVYSSCSKLADPAPETPDPLKEINLTDTLSMYAGNVININYTITPASYDTTKLVWASSDTSVVAVTNSGKISAKKEGTSIISVSNLAKTVTVNCHVSVKDSLSIGLLAYYPFNGSAADRSGHGYNGVANDLQSTADRFGNPESAYAFNGVSSFIDVADKAPLRLNNTDFTLTYWLNMDAYDVSTGSAILAKGNGPYQNGWNTSIAGLGSANANTGNPYYNVSGGDDPHAASNTVVGLNQWKMVTVTYELLTSTISFYVNGEFDHAVSGIPTPNPNTSVDMIIGKNSYINPNTPLYYYKGKLDDIRMYSRKISAYEIKKLYKLTH
jgi:hypothetical protein